MKLSTLTILLSTASAASAAQPMLRNLEAATETETETAETSSRGLQSSCVSASTYLGCYANQNNDRALPLEAFGPKSRGHSAQECKDKCLSMGYTIFALEFRGQCFCGSGSSYTKHGVTSGCDCCGDNVGGNKFCAWEAGTAAPGCSSGSGTDHSTYLGCYNNKNNDRALPFEIPNRKHEVMDCEEECGKLGFSHFSREWKGQCFCGSGSNDYAMHGEASDCDCCGENVGGNKMCVWMNGSI